MEWLDEMTAAVAEAARMKEVDLELPEDVRDEILDIARLASHDSGERTNAPLLCYVIGIAVGQGASLDDLAKVIRAHTES